jgi:pyruvate dehydrogenase E1 component beta subunit
MNRRQLAAQHSHSWEPYAHVPGLIVLSAGTHDARNMLHAALQSTDPCDSVRVYFLIEYGKEIPEEALVTITEAKEEKEKIFRLLLTVLRFINA